MQVVLRQRAQTRALLRSSSEGYGSVGAVVVVLQDEEEGTTMLEKK